MNSYQIKTIKDLFDVVTEENVERLAADVVHLLKVFAITKSCYERKEIPDDFAFTWNDDNLVQTTLQNKDDYVKMTQQGDCIKVDSNVDI